MSNKVEIKIMFEAEKLDALEVFLGENNSSVQKKLVEGLQFLYEKTVPEPVRKLMPRPERNLGGHLPLEVHKTRRGLHLLPKRKPLRMVNQVANLPLNEHGTINS